MGIFLPKATALNLLFFALSSGGDDVASAFTAAPPFSTRRHNHLHPNAQIQNERRRTFLFTSSLPARGLVGVTKTADDLLLFAGQSPSYPPRTATLLYLSSPNGSDNDGNDASGSSASETDHTPSSSAPIGEENLSSSSATTKANTTNSRRGIRKRVKDLAKTIIVRPISAYSPIPRPQAIAAVLTDATVGAAELAVEDIRTGGSRIRQIAQSGLLNGAATDAENAAALEGEAASALDAISLAKTAASDAFAAAESAIDEAESALVSAKRELREAKRDAARAIESAERAAVMASRSAEMATVLATNAAAAAEEGAAAALVRKEEEEVETFTEEEASALSYEDVDYHLSEMAPPFIGEDQCLVPGEAVVRVEKAPENSRRIFAGIDIMAGVEDVWKILTDYEHLQNVVPNLVVNDVVDLYDGESSGTPVDPALPDEVQCEQLSKRMKGAKLRQVGGAKVVGINFSARTTLEVREWPEGMPDFAHFGDEVYEGKSRNRRAKDEKGLKLRRYRFPRPFAISRLPTKDISMQSVAKDDGEFRMYQGVWRMQPLPGCAPEGQEAMRLTYAVEISPRPYLPVSLVEGRIAQDLCTNLKAIREFVSLEVPAL